LVLLEIPDDSFLIKLMCNFYKLLDTQTLLHSGISKSRCNVPLKNLRTTFASQYCMRKQGSIFELSRILGHHSVTITESCYASLHPDYLREGMKTFGIDIQTDSPLLAPLVVPLN